MEINALELVREVVEIGAAKIVWPLRRRDVERTRSKKSVKLAASSGNAIWVEGDAQLECILDR